MSRRGRRQALAALVRLLDRGIVSGGDADEMVHLLGRGLGLTGVVLSEGWTYAGWHRTDGITPEWMATYEALNAGDPSASSLPEAPAGSWWLLHRDGPEEALHSPLYEAFCAHDFVDSAVTRLDSPVQGQIVIGLYRHVGSARYDDEDALFLRLLYPYLQGALGTQRALLACEEDPSLGLDDVLQLVQTHAHIGYPERTIEWAPAARNAWLDRFGPPSGHERQAFDRSLLRAADRFYAHGLLGRSARLPGGLRAEMSRVPPRPGESHRLLVLVVDDVPDAGATAGSPAEIVLSPRQRQVARLAASGRSAPEIATHLGVREATVRHHLRAVYRRLGVHRRAELSALLSL